MLLLSMLFISMLMLNNVMAQNLQEEMAKIALKRAMECWSVSSDDYLLAEGHESGICPDQNIAEQSARLNCTRKLVEQVNGELQAAIDGSFEELGLTVQNCQLTGRVQDIKDNFTIAINKSIGFLEGCGTYATYDEKGNWHCTYYGRLSKAELKKAVETEMQDVNMDGVDLNKFINVMIDKLSNGINNKNTQPTNE